MKKIVFIHPRSKLQIEYWSSEVLNLLMNRATSSSLKLAPMIFAAITPPIYEFIYVDEEIEEIDFQMDADLVAITAMTGQINRAYEIADQFRSAKIPVVIGGIHASVLPDEVGQHCDVVMIGEGENIWPAMLEDFEHGTLKKVYAAKDYPKVEYLPSPKIDVVKHEHYLMFPLQATRGCPYECEFCSIKHSAGHHYRMKPIEQVIAEIKAYEKYNKKTFGVYKKSYVLVDDNLYVNREYAKKLFTAMSELDISWMGQGTLDTAFDEEILTLMAKSGCKTYAIGFESFSDETLREVNKPKVHNIDNYDTAIKNLIRHGIMPAGFLIYGFDNDDVNIFQKTIDIIQEKHLIQAHFNLLTPYPGTKLYDRINGEGRIIDQNWDNYINMKTVFEPKQMSPATLEAGLNWTVKKFATFDTMVKLLGYFWSQGPWPNNKTLSLRERMILIMMGLKLRKYSKGMCKFLFWAARQKNACSFGTILAGIVVFEVVEKARGHLERLIAVEGNDIPAYMKAKD
ncbi:MAG: B12-binding domain-containing radical SAM protein [Firmicutes bacterium]|nr:B12-binding domain-containing radical SAM protein [Bacillota bacterium]